MRSWPLVRRAMLGASCVALLATVAFVGAAPAATAQGARQALTPITVAVSATVPDAGKPWVTSPIGFGFFTKEGLSPNYVWDNGSATALAQVATGQVNFSESSPENLINALEAGEPLHVVATLMPRSIYHIGVLANSPITSYAQLAGKAVGVSSLTSGSYPFGEAAMAENNVSVKYVPVGTGGTAAQALQSGQVAALSTWSTQWATIQALGIQVRMLPPPSLSTLPADVIVTSDSFYSAHPDIAEKFAAATFAGIAKSLQNLPQAVGFFEQQFPEEARASTPAADAVIMQAELNDLNLSAAQRGRWGYIDVAGYEKLQNLDLNYGTIKSPGVSISQVFSNKLVPAIDKIVGQLLGTQKTGPSTVLVSFTTGRKFVVSSAKAHAGKVSVVLANEGKEAYSCRIAGRVTPKVRPGKTATVRLNLAAGAHSYSCRSVGKRIIRKRGSFHIAR